MHTGYIDRFICVICILLIVTVILTLFYASYRLCCDYNLFIDHQALNTLILPPEPATAISALSSAERYDDFWNDRFPINSAVTDRTNRLPADRMTNIGVNTNNGLADIDFYAKRLVDKIMESVIKEYAQTPDTLTDTDEDRERGGTSTSLTRSQFPPIRPINGFSRTTSEMNSSSALAASELLSDAIDSLFLSPALNRKKLAVQNEAGIMDIPERDAEKDEAIEDIPETQNFAFSEEWTKQRANSSGMLSPQAAPMQDYESGNPGENGHTDQSTTRNSHYYEASSVTTLPASRDDCHVLNPARLSQTSDAQLFEVRHSKHKGVSKHDLGMEDLEELDNSRKIFLATQKKSDDNNVRVFENSAESKVKVSSLQHAETRSEIDSDFDDFFDNGTKSFDTPFRYNFDTLESSASTALNQSSSTNLQSSEGSQAKLISSLIPDDVLKQNLHLDLLQEIDEQSSNGTPRKSTEVPILERSPSAASLGRVRSAKKVVRARAELRLLRHGSGSSTSGDEIEDLDESSDAASASKMLGRQMGPGINRTAEIMKSEKDDTREEMKLADDVDSDWPSYNGDSFESDKENGRLDINPDANDPNRLLQSSIISSSQLANLKAAVKNARDDETEDSIEEGATDHEDGCLQLNATSEMGQAVSADSLLSELSPPGTAWSPKLHDTENTGALSTQHRNNSINDTDADFLVGDPLNGYLRPNQMNQIRVLQLTQDDLCDPIGGYHERQWANQDSHQERALSPAGESDHDQTRSINGSTVQDPAKRQIEQSIVTEPTQTMARSRRASVGEINRPFGHMHPENMEHTALAPSLLGARRRSVCLPVAPGDLSAAPLATASTTHGFNLIKARTDAEKGSIKPEMAKLQARLTTYPEGSPADANALYLRQDNLIERTPDPTFTEEETPHTPRERKRLSEVIRKPEHDIVDHSDTESTESFENDQLKRQSATTPEIDDQEEPLSPFSQFMKLVQALPETQDCLYSIQEEDEDQRPTSSRCRPHVPPLDLGADEDTLATKTVLTLQHHGLCEIYTHDENRAVASGIKRKGECMGNNDEERPESSFRESSDIVDGANPALLTKITPAADVAAWLAAQPEDPLHTSDHGYELTSQNSFDCLHDDRNDIGLGSEASLNQANTELQPDVDALLQSYSNSKGSLKDSVASKPPFSPMPAVKFEGSAPTESLSPVPHISRHDQNRKSNNSDLLESSSELLSVSPSKEAVLIQMFENGPNVSSDFLAVEQHAAEPEIEPTARSCMNDGVQNVDSELEDRNHEAIRHSLESTNEWKGFYSPDLRRLPKKHDHESANDHQANKNSYTNDSVETKATSDKSVCIGSMHESPNNLPRCCCGTSTDDTCTFCRPHVLQQEPSGLIENCESFSQSDSEFERLLMANSQWWQGQQFEGRNPVRVTDNSCNALSSEILTNTKHQPQIGPDRVTFFAQPSEDAASFCRFVQALTNNVGQASEVLLTTSDSWDTKTLKQDLAKVITASEGWPETMMECRPSLSPTPSLELFSNCDSELVDRNDEATFANVLNTSGWWSQHPLDRPGNNDVIALEEQDSEKREGNAHRLVGHHPQVADDSEEVETMRSISDDCASDRPITNVSEDCKTKCDHSESKSPSDKFLLLRNLLAKKNGLKEFLFVQTAEGSSVGDLNEKYFPYSASATGGVHDFAVHEGASSLESSPEAKLTPEQTPISMKIAGFASNELSSAIRIPVQAGGSTNETRMYADLSDDESDQSDIDSQTREIRPRRTSSERNVASPRPNVSVDDRKRHNEVPLCFAGSVFRGFSQVLRPNDGMTSENSAESESGANQGNHQPNIAVIFNQMEDVLKVTVVDGVPQISMSTKMETKKQHSESDEESDLDEAKLKPGPCNGPNQAAVNGCLHEETRKNVQTVRHFHQQHDLIHVNHNGVNLQPPDRTTSAGLSTISANRITASATGHDTHVHANHLQQQNDASFVDKPQKTHGNIRSFSVRSDYAPVENGIAELTFHDLAQVSITQITDDTGSNHDFANDIYQHLPGSPNHRRAIYSVTTPVEDTDIDYLVLDESGFQDKNTEHIPGRLLSTGFAYNDREDEADMKAYTINLNTDDEEVGEEQPLIEQAALDQLDGFRQQHDQTNSADSSPDGYARKSVSWRDLGKGAPLEQGPTVNKNQASSLKPIIKTKTSPTSDNNSITQSAAGPADQAPPRPIRPTCLFSGTDLKRSIERAVQHANQTTDSSAQTDMDTTIGHSRTNAAVSPFPFGAAYASTERAPSPTSAESLENVNSYSSRVLLGDLMALVNERDAVVEALEVFVASSTSPALHQFASYGSQRYIQEYAGRLRLTKLELDKRIDELVQHLKQLHLSGRLDQSHAWLFSRSSIHLTYKNPPSKTSASPLFANTSLGISASSTGLGTVAAAFAFSSNTFSNTDVTEPVPCPRFHLSPLDYHRKLLELRRTLVQTCTDMATAYADSIIYDTFRYSTSYGRSDSGLHEKASSDEHSSQEASQQKLHIHASDCNSSANTSGYGDSWQTDRAEPSEAQDTGVIGMTLLNEIRELRAVSREAINSGKDALRSSGAPCSSRMPFSPGLTANRPSSGPTSFTIRPKSMTAEDSRIDAEIASLLRMYRQKLLGVETKPNRQIE